MQSLYGVVFEHVEVEHGRQDENPGYFDNLDNLKAYFAEYLKKIGVEIENVGK